MRYEFDIAADDARTVGEMFIELIDAEIPFSVFVADETPVVDIETDNLEFITEWSNAHFDEDPDVFEV
jgi:hypothetical protein